MKRPKPERGSLADVLLRYLWERRGRRAARAAGGRFPRPPATSERNLEAWTRGVKSQYPLGQWGD